MLERIERLERRCIVLSVMLALSIAPWLLGAAGVSTQSFECQTLSIVDANGQMRAMLDANGFTIKNADGSQCTVGPTAIMLRKDKDGKVKNFAALAVRNDAGALLLKADGKDGSIGLSAEEAKFGYTKGGEGAFVKRD